MPGARSRHRTKPARRLESGDCCWRSRVRGAIVVRQLGDFGHESQQVAEPDHAGVRAAQASLGDPRPTRRNPKAVPFAALLTRWAFEIRLRAERKAGHLLRTMEKRRRPVGLLKRKPVPRRYRFLSWAAATGITTVPRRRPSKASAYRKSNPRHGRSSPAFPRRTSTIRALRIRAS